MSEVAKTPEIPKGQGKKRVAAIDAFRGFTIFAMIFVIQVAGYKLLPLTFPHFNSAPVSTFKHAGEDGDAEEWKLWNEKHPEKVYKQAKVIKVNEDKTYDVQIVDEKDKTEKIYTNQKVVHAVPLKEDAGIIAIVNQGADIPEFRGVGNGCTFTDLVAPFFVFIVGMCIPLSKKGRGADWWKHAGFRTIGLIIAGIIYISLILKLSYWWGILQAIGIAYFMGAFAVRFPLYARWIMVAAIALIHEFMLWHFPWWHSVGDLSKPFFTIATPDGDMLKPLIVHCTPWASISYGLLTIVGTILGEAIVTKDSKKIITQSLIIGSICTIAGYFLHVFHAPMNKDVVSSAYSVFTSGIGALTFLGFYLLMDIAGYQKWAWFLTVYGSNALLAYFMQPVVRIFITALGFKEFYGGGVGWQGVYAGLNWTILLWCVVLFFNKKNIYWKL